MVLQESSGGSKMMEWPIIINSAERPRERIKKNYIKIKIATWIETKCMTSFGKD
jgi:hypothetical protein